MNQHDLARAVARATGETVDRIRRIGFTFVEVPRPEDAPSHRRRHQRRRRRKHSRPLAAAR